MNAPQRRFWEAIRIMPEKWMQHPYGDAGNGFKTFSPIPATSCNYLLHGHRLELLLRVAKRQEQKRLDATKHESSDG